MALARLLHIDGFSTRGESGVAGEAIEPAGTMDAQRVSADAHAIEVPEVRISAGRLVAIFVLSFACHRVTGQQFYFMMMGVYKDRSCRRKGPLLIFWIFAELR